jgi:hypothetical protein
VADLLAGKRILAADFAAAQIGYDATAINSGTAGSYFSGTPGVIVEFVAPTTGRVLIGTSCFVDTGAASSHVTFVSAYRLGSTSGDDDEQAEAEFERASRYPVFTDNPEPIGGGVAWGRPSGLTPGVTYYAEWRGQQKAAAGGLVVLRGRKIIVAGAQ